MVALAHLEKYIATHPDDFPDKGAQILVAARQMATNGIIEAGYTDDLIGKAHAGELFRLMSCNPAYLEISAANAGKLAIQ